ncbi:E3 ubiquitin-protein ligase TRIM56 [Carettochelys insculpta]|uniref:E3 ubiquitin-protein ligase TRIM56 n=1 Tax=Carettochelys insculpta TaxID=44489 RepID=UPI003EB73DF1
MTSDAPSPSDAAACLICPICLERLRRPAALPCRHTFCQGCLEGLVGTGERLRCPECQEDVSLLQQGADLRSDQGLPLEPELEMEPGPVCTLCPLVRQGRAQPAVSHCLECADNLCRACAAGHRCSRFTHTHRLLGLTRPGAGQCHEPPAQEPGFTCRPGTGAVCQALEEAAEARRPLLAALLAEAEETASRAARARAALEEGLSQLRLQEAGLRDVAERVCAEAGQRLQAHREQVLGTLRRCVEGQEVAASRLRAELGVQERLACGTAEAAREVLHRGQAAEILSLGDELAERLARLRAFCWEPLRLPRPRLLVLLDPQSLSRLFQLELGEDGAPRGGSAPEPALTSPVPEQVPTPCAPQLALKSSAPEPASSSRALVPPGPALVPPAPALVPPTPALVPPAPAPVPPGPQPAPSQPSPIAHFSCSFSVRVAGDKRQPRITGLCPLSPSELVVADEENRSLKLFSLQGSFRGTVPVHGEAAPCSVAAVADKLAYTAGSRLYLVERDGTLVWQRVLRPYQASHAVAPVVEGGVGVAVSVAGHLEVYDSQGQLVQKIYPDGGDQLALVFMASQRGSYMASDWYRRRVVVFDGHGRLQVDLPEEQLERCQPGAVCADGRGCLYVVLRELNKVVAFGPGGEALGPFLTARHGVNRARVATVTGDGRFALALSGGTIRVFRIQYPEP